jgi:hypothetical protein
MRTATRAATRNWLDRAQRDGPVAWSCVLCDGGGQFLDDATGRADHRAATGHQPRPGRPLAPLMGLRR